MKNTKEANIAIIGGGIAGLSSAYHLHQQARVTLYERNTKLGGHTDTHSFELDGQTVRIDSGFIIFCPQYYPHFSAMLDDLGVASKATDMSFSAFNRQTGTVYNATNPNKLFCDRRNLVKPAFWRMLFDIVRFYQQSPSQVKQLDNELETVDDYLRRNGYGSGFVNDHLLPMISALWSATPERVKLFPIKHLVDFFQAHGLMKLVARPQWLVVKNGSASYVEALQAKLNCEWRLGASIAQINREADGIIIEEASGKKRRFDAVIMACHADTSLELLGDSTQAEKDILGAIPFEKNHVVVHTDDSIMHPNKRAWASWNTEVPHASNPNSLGCCTANYWMNSLQGLTVKRNVFTTLNGVNRITEDKILAERYYSHPVFTPQSVAAQRRLPEINGKQNTYYAGAYWGWGFHEDGARSAWQSAQLLLKKLRSRAKTAQRSAA